MTRKGRLTGLALVALLAAAPAAAAGTAAAKKRAKKKSPGIVVRSATATATGNGAIATATATCPKKTRALSGGFLLSPPVPGGNVGLVYESQKLGQNAWRVSAQNLDSGAPESLTLAASVYCRKGAPKTSTITASGPKPAALQIGPAVAPTCTGKKNAMAGGMLTGAPVIGAVANEVTIESARTTAKTWQSNFLSGASGTDTLSGYAYCAKGKPPAAVSATSAPNAVSTSTTTVTASCSGKRKLVGGGFAEPTLSLLVPGGFFILLESQRTSATTWQVSGLKVSSAPATLSATAYCAK